MFGIVGYILVTILAIFHRIKLFANFSVFKRKNCQTKFVNKFFNFDPTDTFPVVLWVDTISQDPLVRPFRRLLDTDRQRDNIYQVKCRTKWLNVFLYKKKHCLDMKEKKKDEERIRIKDFKAPVLQQGIFSGRE